MSTLFTSRGYTPLDSLALNGGAELHLPELSPFLRVLLITDGTVTKSIESFFWEPVAVIKVRQQREILQQDLHSIEKKQGDEIIVRDVRLVGEQSDTVYAYASSVIRPDALPETICRDLELDRVGIGELLRECGLETYRELIHFDKATVSGVDCITRTYRIVMGQHPFIEITEKFPVHVYLSGGKKT